MRIDALKKYQRRNGGDYFSDLPTPVRARAEQLLSGFRARWADDLPQWRYGILVAQARRLALNPPDSA